MEEIADKLGFEQTFLFFHHFLFIFFSSSVSLFYVSATALNKSAVFQVAVYCDLTWVWHVKEQVCQPKFAVWKLLKIALS